MENLKRVLNISPELIDSAYGQNIITFNEFRMFLGLPPVKNGDICKNGDSLVVNSLLTPDGTEMYDRN